MPTRKVSCLLLVGIFLWWGIIFYQHELTDNTSNFGYLCRSTQTHIFWQQVAQTLEQDFIEWE